MNPRTKQLTVLAMLTAIAFVVMYLSKALPSVYGFLDFDFKDTIICIGGFVFGPVAAAAVSVAGVVSAGVLTSFVQPPNRITTAISQNHHRL